MKKAVALTNNGLTKPFHDAHYYDGDEHYDVKMNDCDWFLGPYKRLSLITTYPSPKAEQIECPLQKAIEAKWGWNAVRV